MNAPRKIIGTAGTHPAPRTLVGKCVPNADRQSGAGLPLPCWHEPSNPSGGGSAVDLHTPIGAAAFPSSPPSFPTGEAGAPNLSTPNDGYGTKPRCLTCGRGQAGCICNMPDPEPEYFKPGLNRDPDWYRVEM